MNRDRLAKLPRVLFEIGKLVSSGEDLGEMLSRIAELSCELVEADACSIMLLDSSSELLTGKAAHGLRGSDIRSISFRVGEGVAGNVAASGQAALISDVRNDDRFVDLPASKASLRSQPRQVQSRIRSLVCVPLEARDRLVGVLTATGSEVGTFGVEEQDFLGFVAKTIALDIENLRLRRLAVTDQLTGAYNREFLHERLPEELAKADSGGHPLSLAMVDVDHFKPINDRYGHDVGDLVLTEVAHKLRAAIRSDDVLVRYGGEEFLVLLPSTSARVAREVAERMRLTLQEGTFFAGDAPIEVRISVGIAEHLRGSDSPTTLIRRADSALYAAKESGRNRVEVAG
ncbi:MAG: sensor domain-containing diguanylate cyclase [Deltaproteobacteria bacterium]|nr:sensor domain-containing diguanylate cyclase [Deltaproteobacteria bacterium]